MTQHSMLQILVAQELEAQVEHYSHAHCQVRYTLYKGSFPCVVLLVCLSKAARSTQALSNLRTAFILQCHDVAPGLYWCLQNRQCNYRWDVASVQPLSAGFDEEGADMQ